MRDILADEPALAAELIVPSVAPLLSPLVSPPLSEHEAAGLDLILEGFLLHHGRPRHLAPSAPGREVLAGDYCYAHGLVRIASAGDLFVVGALADLIALGAGLVADDHHAALVPLWRGTTAAIAARRGPDEAMTGALFLAAQESLRRHGDFSGLAALAAELPPTPGLDEALAR